MPSLVPEFICTCASTVLCLKPVSKSGTLYVCFLVPLPLVFLPWCVVFLKKWVLSCSGYHYPVLSMPPACLVLVGWSNISVQTFICYKEQALLYVEMIGSSELQAHIMNKVCYIPQVMSLPWPDWFVKSEGLLCSLICTFANFPQTGQR